MKTTKNGFLFLAANIFGIGMIYLLYNRHRLNLQIETVITENRISTIPNEKTQFKKDVEEEKEEQQDCTNNNTSQYKFQHYDLNKPDIYQIPDDSNKYFQTFLNVTCFIEGTNWEKTLLYAQCKCLPGWYGDDCGIPGSVWVSLQMLRLHNRITRRPIPRRVLNALNVNHEFDFFEARIHELENSVDVYLVGESNYSAFGERKPMLFYQRFRDGFLKNFQSKFVYVFQDHFPAGGQKNGWIADDYQRSFLTEQGLKQIRGLRDDDILLLSDADELPRREVITFLKLYDNYLDPIKLAFIWTIYKFCWLNRESPTQVMAVSTIKTFKTHFKGNGALLRSNREGPAIQPWVIGVGHLLAGWHCSWCFVNPEDIRVKLISAQNGDRPRWGDFPEKTDVNYIKHIVRTGIWFDNKTHFVFRKPTQDYAPKFYLVNVERFHSLLYIRVDYNLSTTEVKNSTTHHIRNSPKDNSTII